MQREHFSEKGEEKKTEIGKMITMFERLSPTSQEIINANIAVLLASQEARKAEQQAAAV